MAIPRDRPVRFGIQAKPTGTGYATMTMPDHFDDQLAPVPALQCAADATTMLRLGALVHANDYKHPVVLAKELATMDVLSGGRIGVSATCWSGRTRSSRSPRWWPPWPAGSTDAKQPPPPKYGG